MTPNIPVERLQATSASTTTDFISPLQPGCYAAIATQIKFQFTKTRLVVAEVAALLRLTNLSR
jgi:hypothetical protein